MCSEYYSCRSDGCWPTSGLELVQQLGKSALGSSCSKASCEDALKYAVDAKTQAASHPDGISAAEDAQLQQMAEVLGIHLPQGALGGHLIVKYGSYDLTLCPHVLRMRCG